MRLVFAEPELVPTEGRLPSQWLSKDDLFTLYRRYDNDEVDRMGIDRIMRSLCEIRKAREAQSDAPRSQDTLGRRP